MVFGFEYGKQGIVSNYKIKRISSDLLKPFERETDLTDIETINIAALLVDYKLRPFRIFAYKTKGIETVEELTKVEDDKM